MTPFHTLTFFVNRSKRDSTTEPSRASVAEGNGQHREHCGRYRQRLFCVRGTVSHPVAAEIRKQSDLVCLD